ncbi:carbonic anhydrase [Bimuria novae-zelandiae CBS 107.79]|uniref:Carbonic anhydrase n=1 Tax=Bimuria novae-zelandiae CBS 107.79 TaxID=1447943 RepID=A0A6A5VRM2_9PLEO|nr:carbonic anhydrase [Bimuria novae-zelandiae CBS 107.79]
MDSRIRFIAAAVSLLAGSLACPDHRNNEPYRARGQVTKRADETGNGIAPDWAYEASYNWHVVNPDYYLCQNGTQQSPIALSMNQGLSHNHIPTFDYLGQHHRQLLQLGLQPLLRRRPRRRLDYTPSATYDNETIYLKGWHIHAPADHSVAGVRTKAELLLVHVDAAGAEHSVFAIRLDPGNARSAFFDQLPAYFCFTDTRSQCSVALDIDALLTEAKHFNEFWTYRGSLTSPPCTEGIRFFQMQGILGVSSFSARAEQEVWEHRINE